MTLPTSDESGAGDLERLFQQALDQPAALREAWLQEHGRDNPALRAEVQALLRLDAQNADGLLEGVRNGAFAEQVPERIGAYVVSRLLAQGGMSAVFDAVHATTGARAAVKLIRVGMATPRQQARFQLESELLATLNHRSIARLFDAGKAEAVYPDGTSARRSFIAMEFVEGESISRHCQRHALPFNQRVRLMLGVARAVQHAHERGVVHRDLKPDNILVTAPDREHPIGSPKVVDFGIAKLMSPGRNATVPGVIMGTLNYMSPEQMGGRGAEVGPASDVYALGAVLYELLAGRPPIEAPSTLSPGAALAMLGAQPTRIISMCADVPLDLDAIVHKAIDHTIARRYATARELADDLERWLENRPVEARQPTAIDRARLLYRRHPTLSVGVAVAVASVLTLGSLATWQAVRASRAERTALDRLGLITAERDRADEQARVAEAVRLFLSNDILALANVESQADVGIKSNPDIKLVEVLDRAAVRVGDGRFADKPAVEAALRSTIGNAYIGLGKPGKAIEHLKRAVELNSRTLGPQARATLDTRASHASATDAAGKHAEAIALFEPLLADARSALGTGHSLTLTIANNLAITYLHAGRRDDADALTRESLPVSTKSVGPANPVTLRLANTRSVIEFAAGKAESEERLLAAIELNRKTFGDDYPDTLVAKSNLGLFFKRNGDNRKALEIFEPVVETSIARLGREHPKTLVFVNDLATIYTANGDHKKAADMLAEVLAIHTITLGEDHATTLTTLHNLAAVRVQLGELDAGSKLLRQAYDASTRVRGANAQGTLLDGSNLAETYRRMGKLDEAWTLATDVIERMNTHLGPAHKYTLSARCMSANVLLDQKKPEQAEPILRDGLATATAAFGPAFPLVNKYRRDLAKCLDALGKAEEAAEVRGQITK